MLDFIFHSHNSFFAIAILIVAFIFVIEVLGQVIGLSIGQLLDNTINIDAEVNFDGADSLSTSADILSWLNLRKLPVLIWLIIFLTGFSIIGYIANYLSLSLTNNFLANVISVPIALIFAIYICHFLGGKLAQLMPKEQTSAISKTSFSGNLARITIGTARQGQPAEAVFTDEYGQKHYVLVEPMDNDEFSQGEQVVLVSNNENQWLVTRFE